VAWPSGTGWGKSEAASGSSCSVSRVGSCTGLGLKSGSAAGELRSGWPITWDHVGSSFWFIWVVIGKWKRQSVKGWWCQGVAWGDAEWSGYVKNRSSKIDWDCHSCSGRIRKGVQFCLGWVILCTTRRPTHCHEVIGLDSVGSRSKGKGDRVRSLSRFNRNKEKTMSG
jgi:hypothetical protein